MRIDNRHGAVTVDLVEHSSGVPVRFIVRGSSGYVAVLPACHFDQCLSGERECCAIPLTTDHGSRHAVRVEGKVSHSVDKWLKHSRTHCHKWHWPTVERFARDVLKTYRGAR